MRREARKNFKNEAEDAVRAPAPDSIRESCSATQRVRVLQGFPRADPEGNEPSAALNLL
jgi:hypothetical protein